MGWDEESVESEIEVLLWGETKRSEVVTTFSGRSTVIKSSFSGTILEMIQTPFFLIYIFFGGKGGASAGILRVRSIERGFWRLLSDEIRSPSPSHNKTFFSLHQHQRRPGEEEKKLRK